MSRQKRAQLHNTLTKTLSFIQAATFAKRFIIHSEHKPHNNKHPTSLAGCPEVCVGRETRRAGEAEEGGDFLDDVKGEL